MIFIGFTTNVYVVGHVFSPDKELSSGLIRGIIWIWNISCAVYGILLLKFSRRVYPRRITSSHILFICISTIIAVCVAEGIVRILGYENWRVGRLGADDIHVGGNMRYSVIDSVLGHTIMPGEITITMPTGLTFSATHNENRSRATHMPPREATGREIWTLGCSFTYGWAVDDTGSYPWKLQARVPEYEVVNFGISGYGTLQSFMWFQENLMSYSPPSIAILGYVPWHEERNVLARSWKKNLSKYKELSFMEHPYGFLGEDGELCIARSPISYTGLPLIRYSAFCNLFDDFVNRIDMRCRNSIKLTATIIDSFAATAERAGTTPVVAFMMDDPVSHALLSYCRIHDIPRVDISVDLNRPENSLHPFDPHPSAYAHQQYADKIFVFLKKEDLIEPRYEIASDE